MMNLMKSMAPGSAVIASAALAFALSGCERQPTDSAVPPASEEQAPPVLNESVPMNEVQPPPNGARDEETPRATEDFSGVLASGFVGIGGEHTGWVLSGTARGDYEVDVSGIAEEARALEGLKVVVTGRLVSKDYLERGPTLILVADSIRRAD